MLDEERTSSRVRKRKRNAGPVDEGARHVLNLIDSDEESNGQKDAGKKARAQISGTRTPSDEVGSLSGPSGSSRMRNPARHSDVIVIDD